MDQELDKKIETKDKIVFYLKKNKLKLLFVIFIAVLIFIFFIFFKMNFEKKNNLISERYIEAGLYLSSNDEKKAKEIYEEIIYSKNNFYSILALNTLLEKKLELNQEKVLDYFLIIEDLNISNEQRDLIIFKKALFLIKNSKFNEGKQLLKQISESESKLKNIAKEILKKNK